jgi:hypothetical protein
MEEDRFKALPLQHENDPGVMGLFEQRSLSLLQKRPEAEWIALPEPLSHFYNVRRTLDPTRLASLRGVLVHR